MKLFIPRQLTIGLASLLVHLAASGAPASDVAGVAARRDVVATALRLVEPAALTPVPADLVNLFNPTAFNQPSADELAAREAAKAALAAAGSTQSKLTTDDDLLEHIADRVVPSGVVTLGDEPLLVFGQKRLRVGDRLTVTYDGRDHQLELTGIQRFTFTLRLNRAEITRRINPGKNP